jgi:hypothetical protein
MMSSRYGVQMVRSSDFPQMLEAADDGSEEARRFCRVLDAWSRSAGKLCFSCSRKVKPKNFGGLGAAICITGADGDGAYAAAFCDRCEEKGPDVLSELFLHYLVDEVKLRIHDIKPASGMIH